MPLNPALREALSAELRSPKIAPRMANPDCGWVLKKWPGKGEL